MADETEAALDAAVAAEEAAVEGTGEPNPLSPGNPAYDGPGTEATDEPSGRHEVSSKDVSALMSLMEQDDEVDDVAANVQAMLSEEESLVAVEEDETEEEQPSDPAVARDLDKARTALKRDGWTDAEMDGLEPGSILAKGKRSREAEADRERLRQRLELLESGKEGPRDGDSPAQAAESPPVASELTSLLASELGEEVSGPFKAYVDGVEQRQAHLEQMLQRMVSEQFSSVETSERQRVGERFPDLLDDAVYTDKVKPQLDELAELPRYKGKGMAVLPDLLEKAALLAGLERVDPDAVSAASEERSQATRRKRAGTSKGPGRSRQTMSNVSDEALEGESLRVMTRSGPDSPEFKVIAKELRRRQAAKA